MINKIMKKNGEKAYINDLKRIDYSVIDKSITDIKNINYISDNISEHNLDIYYKDNDIDKPILIDIHGGGFISNDKELNHLFGNYMAQKGFVVVNLNYRLAYPKYTVFDQIYDIDNALKWVVKNINKYNGNIDKMYIAGHSSAAVLAVMESLFCEDDKIRNNFKLQERTYKYKGIILDCGLMEFYKNNIAYWGMRNMIFPKGYKRNQFYKDMVFKNNNSVSKLPKIALITNSKDELREMTYHFKEILDKTKNQYRLIDAGNDGHMGIIFKPYTKDNQKIIDEICDFLI